MADGTASVWLSASCWLVGVMSGITLIVSTKSISNANGQGWKHMVITHNHMNDMSKHLCYLQYDSIWDICYNWLTWIRYPVPLDKLSLLSIIIIVSTECHKLISHSPTATIMPCKSDQLSRDCNYDFHCSVLPRHDLFLRNQWNGRHLSDFIS